jgi:hypothetical protein
LFDVQVRLFSTSRDEKAEHMSTMPSWMQDPEGKYLGHSWEQRSASREASYTVTAHSDRHVHITFAHVTGFGKVKQELQEVVTFLQAAQEGGQSESKTMKLALFGQREYSRTILVSAVAGEAQVPLFYLAGTTLFEMLVGVRKRGEFDLHPDEYAAFKRGGVQEYIHYVFVEAKRAAPSLLWLDALEVSIVQQREQVLHQLLREIDDLAQNQRIALIMTTSQPDALDPAFFLHGRLERRVVMERPHLHDPEAIVPTQAGIPAFTEADVRRYYQSHHSAVAKTISGDPPTVIQATFMTNREAQHYWKSIDFRLPENEIACYVELRGPFSTRLVSIPPGQSLSHAVEYGIEVFDARTGRPLFAGYIPSLARRSIF